MKQTLLIVLLACMAVAVSACTIPPGIAVAGVAAIEQALTTVLAQMVVDGKISAEQFQAITLAMAEAAKLATAKLADTPYHFDGARAMELGGVLISGLLGTSVISRVRRGASIITGKKPS